jgi:hypothetical protein
MAGETTLIVTTRSGVRPLGVRGEPLHNAAPQLRRVVRRRLGNEAAGLLADPQPHEDGKAIDWYAEWPGEIRPLSALEANHRTEVLATVERTLADIRRLGDTLAGAGPREDMGVVGLSLQLAARAPAQSFIFMVGDRPVIACWGYEKEAAAALLAVGLPRPPAPSPPAAHLPARRAVLEPTAIATVPRLASTTIPWLRTLLLALPLLLLLMAGAWLLRGLLPADPDLAVATREGTPAPAPLEAAPDPSPALRAAFSTEQSRGRVLQVELSLVEAELKRRIANCKPPEKPPEPPKAPPQVAVTPPPKPAPVPAPTPPPRQSRPNDDRLRMPPAPSNDYSFMSGCWRTDPFRHEPMQGQPGISSYCFDANGNGQLEWRRGRTACRTRAQARFEGSTLRVRDGDSTCNDGSRWYADQLVCRRGADDVAQCSGASRGAFGPVTWTVNLHKLN